MVASGFEIGRYNPAYVEYALLVLYCTVRIGLPLDRMEDMCMQVIGSLICWQSGPGTCHGSYQASSLSIHHIQLNIHGHHHIYLKDTHMICIEILNIHAGAESLNPAWYLLCIVEYSPQFYVKPLFGDTPVSILWTAWRCSFGPAVQGIISYNINDYSHSFGATLKPTFTYLHYLCNLPVTSSYNGCCA